jgi:hypothetical protein
MTTPTAQKPTPQQPTPPAGPYDPMFGLQEKVASLLTPMFQDARTDELFAYQIACRSLQAYEPETRADFVNAGRTIAFSLASLVILKEAFNPALELEDKKRVAVHANALNRSADQAERSMMERRRYQRAYPTFPVLQQPEPDDTQAQTQVAEAVTAYTAAQPSPPKPAEPEVSPAAPPIQHPAIHYGASRDAKHPDPVITPAILHAVNLSRPAPYPF